MMNTVTRRSAITVSLAWCALPQQHAAGDETSDRPEAPAAAITAPEDLMREHGVLNRLMLVYEAAIAPSAVERAGIHEVLHEAASLIRSFIEDYHGKLEEKFLFPEFDRQRTHANLVNTLREQHRIGRDLTGVVLKHATEDGLADITTRAALSRACRDFVRMFRAHEAWEDTVLFPAFRRLVSPTQLVELGEQFEDIEHRTFGKDGFADTVQRIAQLERHVGIQGLDAFTPQDQRPASR